MRRPFIVVAGNIGSGKERLVSFLASELGLEPYLESPQDNPYIQDFYQDMNRWALASQLVFLAEGIKNNRHIQHREGAAIEERSVFEHFMVFCHELHQQQRLSDRDFSVLSDLYYSVEDLLTPPDLLIYLDVPVEELHRRQPPNSGVKLEYLQRLDTRYNEFLNSWFRSPVLRIPAQDQSEARSEEIAEIITTRLEDLS